MTRPLEQTCGSSAYLHLASPGRDPLSYSVNFSLRCLYCTCFLPEVFSLAPLGATVSQQGVRVGGSMPRLPHSRGGCRGRQQFLEILRSSILQWQPTFSFSPSLSHLLHCVTCGFRIHFPNKLPAPKPLSNHLLWGNSS